MADDPLMGKPCRFAYPVVFVLDGILVSKDDTHFHVKDRQGKIHYIPRNKTRVEENPGFTVKSPV